MKVFAEAHTVIRDVPTPPELFRRCDSLPGPEGPARILWCMLNHWDYRPDINVLVNDNFLAWCLIHDSGMDRLNKTTVNLEFGWAKFGMGIPFTSTGMQPPTRTVELGPLSSETSTVTWTPAMAGHQCVLVKLNDADNIYEEQWSQRNVDVARTPPCGVTRTYTLTVFNDSPEQRTVTIRLEVEPPASSRELLSGRTVTWDEHRTTLTLDAEDVAVIELAGQKE